MNSVDLSVLSFDLVAHVNRHVAQVPDHVRYFAHILFHLVLSRVVRYPTTRQTSDVKRGQNLEADAEAEVKNNYEKSAK